MSIIQSAVAVRDDPDYKVTDPHVRWDCMSFDYEGNHYDIAFENNHYGVMVRQFMINGIFDCPVKSKYEGLTLHFDCCNSLLGERPFENGSIAQEFLYTPLGLIKPNSYTEYYADSIFRKFCKEKEIPFKEWTF